MIKITLADHDNMADIAWFLKGWRHGDDGCPFGSSHEESFRKVMENLKEQIRREEKEATK